MLCHLGYLTGKSLEQGRGHSGYLTRMSGVVAVGGEEAVLETA